MPAAQALRLCPETVFLRPRFPHYRAESDAVFALYRQFTPLLQPMSLDEAYLDVTNHLGSFDSATAIAQEIRRRVRGERHLIVSVGVGPNKLIAKIASDWRKPDGLTVVRPSEAAAFLAPLGVGRLYGIGPATERALEAMDVRTVGELRAVSLDRLLTRFGHWGRTLWEAARGLDDRPVRTESERKSLGTEHTFAHDLASPGDMERALDEMAEAVANGLERAGLSACTVTVKVRYPDFTTLTRSQSLSAPASDGATLANCARELLRRTDAVHRAVRLLGVSASGLLPRALEQPLLFSPPDHPPASAG
jgi:DNA polymerase-4